MKKYRLKDVHIESGANGKIFLAIGAVYDENTDGFKVLTNQECIDLLNDATITSSKERKLDKDYFRTSLSDFSTRL